MDKNFLYLDILQHFILVIMIDILVVKKAKANKITQAIRKKVNIKKVKNNTLAFIFLR